MWYDVSRRLVRALPHMAATALLFALLATASHERIGPITREPMAAAGSLLAFSAVVGVLAMAVLEVLRRLLPLRGWFHRRELYGLKFVDHEKRELYGVKFMDPEQPELYGVKFVDTKRVLGRYDLAWFDVPREQFVAQLAALAEIELAREFARVAATPSPREPVDDDAEARANLETELDAFAASVAFRWQRMLRLSACVLAGACGLVTATFSGADVGAVAVSTVAAFVFGGFFAWFARDIVALVEGWRRSL